MNLYKVYNGFRGHTDVHCLVIAHSGEKAIAMARKKFKKENEEYPGYYENLTVWKIFHDCNISQVSDISDE